MKSRDEENAWQEMVVLGLSKLPSSSNPRFQIFSSGLAARHTFMLDTVSGKTWLIASARQKHPDGTETEVVRWVPFEE